MNKPQAIAKSSSKSNNILESSTKFSSNNVVSNMNLEIRVVEQEFENLSMCRDFGSWIFVREKMGKR